MSRNNYERFRSKNLHAFADFLFHNFYFRISDFFLPWYWLNLTATANKSANFKNVLKYFVKSLSMFGKNLKFCFQIILFSGEPSDRPCLVDFANLITKHLSLLVKFHFHDLIYHYCKIPFLLFHLKWIVYLFSLLKAHH